MIGQASKAQARFWIDGLRYRLQGPLHTFRKSDRNSVPQFRPMAFAGGDEYTNHHWRNAAEYERRRRFMRELGATSGRIVTKGYCIACGRPRRFWTVALTPGLDPSVVPNWREGMNCRGCRLNSRMRASIHLLLWALRPEPRCRIYLTEQITALYRWVKLRFPDAVGSEYLRDGTERGSNSRYGIRHEDLTALSFADESFDVIISLEVMEHIPDFRKAFSECARVLKLGGRMLLSVPFHQGTEHLLRARVRDDGSIEHLLPPENHGDPLDPCGCLCFHHFGWDVIDFLKADGFRQATAYSIWSHQLGYLAGEGDLIQFIAVK
jgi:Methyltransferase domain